MIDWTKSDMCIAIRSFAMDNKVQCRFKKSTWTFDLSKNNGCIILNQTMIDFGEWYVEFN